MHGKFGNKTVVAWKRETSESPPPRPPPLPRRNLNIPKSLRPTPDTLHQHETGCLCEGAVIFQKKALSRASEANSERKATIRFEKGGRATEKGEDVESKTK